MVILERQWRYAVRMECHLKWPPQPHTHIPFLRGQMAEVDLVKVGKPLLATQWPLKKNVEICFAFFFFFQIWPGIGRQGNGCDVFRGWKCAFSPCEPVLVHYLLCERQEGGTVSDSSTHSFTGSLTYTSAPGGSQHSPAGPRPLLLSQEETAELLHPQSERLRPGLPVRGVSQPKTAPSLV